MSDLCTDDGAERLAGRIRDFWRKRGFDVEIETHKEGFVAAMRSSRTDLRSDMVNGYPRRPVADGAAA